MTSLFTANSGQQFPHLFVCLAQGPSRTVPAVLLPTALEVRLASHCQDTRTPSLPYDAYGPDATVAPAGAILGTF